MHARATDGYWKKCRVSIIMVCVTRQDTRRLTVLGSGFAIFERRFGVSLLLHLNPYAFYTLQVCVKKSAANYCVQ